MDPFIADLGDRIATECAQGNKDFPSICDKFYGLYTEKLVMKRNAFGKAISVYLNSKKTKLKSITAIVTCKKETLPNNEGLTSLTQHQILEYGLNSDSY